MDLMGKPVLYEIVVRGVLGANWSERLGDMVITTDHSDEKGPVTTLRGRLRDQAALSGVLNSLYDLHLPVIKVDTLEDPDPSAPVIGDKEAVEG